MEYNKILELIKKAENKVNSTMLSNIRKTEINLILLEIQKEAINYSRCCKSDSEQLSCDHRALISIGDGFGNTFCPMCKTYNPTT